MPDDDFIVREMDWKPHVSLKACSDSFPVSGERLLEHAHDVSFELTPAHAEKGSLFNLDREREAKHQRFWQESRVPALESHHTGIRCRSCAGLSRFERQAAIDIEHQPATC